MKEYKVILIQKTQKKTNAILDFSDWEKANCLTDFCSPWKNESFSKIEFRALWDFENLYFKFKVFDTEIYIDKKDESIDSIGNSDRVELFFRKDENLSPYYCLEIDSETRLMDFEAYPDWNFDFNWNWPKEHLELTKSKTEEGFTVEGRISISSLNDLDLIQNNSIETGIYRAKFSKNEKQEYEPTWISWVNPNTETPNFHIASSFGKLVFFKGF